jgi:histidinol phosphatase-like PHP family hydrolase
LVYDFHTQTFHSDGSLSPVELIRRAVVRGYKAVALTDHVGPGNLEEVLRQVTRDCLFCQKHWDIVALPGVEITHVPAAAIAEVASAARRAGARVVVAHGETIVEPVEPGTNLAIARCRDVDILAHPGILTLEVAQAAVESGVFVEISARRGHSLGNGRTVQVCRAAGALMLLNSDAHDPGDLLTDDLARNVALGAGLTDEEMRQVLEENPENLLGRVRRASLGTV